MTHYIVVSSNEIVKPEMERPEMPQSSLYSLPLEGILLEMDWGIYEDDENTFKAHCLSLPRIAIEGEHNWEVWQSVVEGIDFTWKVNYDPVMEGFTDYGGPIPKYPTVVIPIQHKVDSVEYLNEIINLLKSDTVYYALRFAVKNPSKSGVSDLEDDGYLKLYNAVIKLRSLLQVAIPIEQTKSEQGEKLTMIDIPEPIGKFILDQKDLPYMEFPDGYYWHYKDVVTLLKRFATHQR